MVIHSIHDGHSESICLFVYRSQLSTCVMGPDGSSGECRAPCTRTVAEDEQARRMGALLKAHQEQESEKKHANANSKKHAGRDKSTQRGGKGQKQRKGGGGGGGGGGKNSNSRSGSHSQSQGQSGGARGHLPTALQQTVSAFTNSTNQPRYTTLFVADSHSSHGNNRIGKNRNVANGSTGNRSSHSGSGGGGGSGEKSFLRVVNKIQTGGANEVPVVDIVSALPKMEKYQKGLLDSLKAQLDSSSPPVPPLYHAISRSLWDKLVGARSSLFRALWSLVFRDKKAASRRKLLTRMWMVYYRELDVIQQRLRSHTTAQNPPYLQTQQQQQQLRASQAARALLFTVIGEAELAIKSVSDALQEQPHFTSHLDTQSCPSPKQEVEQQSANADSVKVSGKESFPLVMALGDLARYKQIHRPVSEQRDWSVAESYYHRAFRLEPESGKVWNQLAIISSLRKDRFAALYHYLRALCAEDAFPALDNILTLHNRWENQVADMQHKHHCNAKEAEFLPAEENTHRFLAYLVVAAGSCLSSSAGPPDDLIEATVTHLTACLRHRGGLKENFGLRLPPYLLRVVLLCICVVEACAKAWVKAGNEEHEWTSDPATRGGIRMCFSVAAALVDASAADHSQDGVPLPAVCMFLDWLRCESYLGEGMMVSEGKTFWSMMASIARLLSVTTCSSDKLPSLTLDSVGTTVALSASIPLSEDIECQGLPPLRRAITPRLMECSSQDVAVAAVAPGSQEAHAIRLARLGSFADWAVARGWLLKEEASDANSSPQFSVPDKAGHGVMDEVVLMNTPVDTDLNPEEEQQQQNTYDLNSNVGGGGILPWNDMWLSDVPMWLPPLGENSGPGPGLNFEDATDPAASNIPSSCFLGSLERFVNAPTGTTGWDKIGGDEVEVEKVEDEEVDTTEHIAITAALAGLQEDIFDEDIGESSLAIGGGETEAIGTREGLGGARGEAFVGGPMSQVCRVCCSELMLGSTACGLCGAPASPPPPPGLNLLPKAPL